MTEFHGTETNNDAYVGSDFYHGAALQGKYGITDLEKQFYVSELKSALAKLVDTSEYASQKYCGVDKALVKKALEDTIAAAGEVKTSYELDNLKTALNTKVAKAVSNQKKMDALKADYQIDNASGTNNVPSSLTVSLAAGTYLLPGYGVVNTTTYNNLFKDASISNADYSFASNAITDWMLANGYYTREDIQNVATRAALEAELVKISNAADDTSLYDVDDDDATSYTVVANYQLTDLLEAYSKTKITDLEAVLAAYNAVIDFYDNYMEPVTGDAPTVMISEVRLANALKYYVDANLATDWAKISKIKTSDATDNKEAIVAFANKVAEFKDKYDGCYEGYEFDAYNPKLRLLLDAIEEDGDDAVEEARLGFNVAFDAENLVLLSQKDAFEAYKTAFEAYVAEYVADPYLTFLGYTAGAKTELVKAEATIMACEKNFVTLAGKVDVAAEKVDQLLNNATVKVTTVKEGKKVTVNAKIDATSMKALYENQKVATVEYKFYHKAPGKAYKLTKTKAVNHITYTKSLKAGKNSFRVGVVLKDAKGNVVGEKSYKASTVGYRTIK